MADPSASGDRRDDPRVITDGLSGRTVFVAPARAGRPDDKALATAAGSAAADGARSWCPFCAGNEGRTPPDLLRAPADRAWPWHARIVPNRYPVTTDSRAAAADGADRPAYGVHDVVIESARHERSILAVEPEEWRDVWALCQARIAGLAAEPCLAWATVFKNSGGQAGASLEHVHSQLVGLDFVPPVVAAKLDAVAREPHAFAELVAGAEREGRIVAEEAGLVALVPPAPRQPLEAWIVPRGAAPAFRAAAAAEVAAVADLTRWFVGRLERIVPGAAYNWWLHELPFRGPAAEAAAWRWHLEILPRLSPLAGFELGTGCHISTLGPAAAARLLREA
jgi:UDPglucose--hexose-1-phosphate uridylyltransferase